MAEHQKEFERPEEKEKSLSRKRSRSLGADPSCTITIIKKPKTVGVSEDRDELECAICADTYKDPKLLQCMHTFCNDCIERLWNSKDKKNVGCPICRFVTKVGDDGTSNLFRNHIIQQKVKWKEVAAKRESNELLCSDCEAEVPTNICTDCCWQLCDFCTAHHKRTVRFKGHSIQSIEAVANEELIEKKPVRCAHHRREVEFYCETCSKVTCAECVQSKAHERHLIQSLEENMEKRLIALHGSIDQLDQVCEQYEKYLKDFESFHRKAIEERDASTKRVDDAFAEIEEIIFDAKQKLRNWLNEKCELSDQALQRAKERVYHVKTMCQYFKEVTRYPKEEIFDIVQNGFKELEDIVESMNSLKKVKPVALPAVLELAFLPANSATNRVKNEHENVFDVEIYARQILSSDSFAAVKTSLKQLGEVPVNNPITDGAFLFNEAVLMGPSGIIELEVKNVSKLETSVWSKEILIGNMSWSLNFNRRVDETSKEGSAATYVYCKSGGAGSPENCYAHCVVSAKNRNSADYSRTLIYKFEIPTNRGWPSFIPWEDLLDPSRGFVKNGSVSIDVHIQVLPYKVAEI